MSSGTGSVMCCNCLSRLLKRFELEQRTKFLASVLLSHKKVPLHDFFADLWVAHPLILEEPPMTIETVKNLLVVVGDAYYV